MNTCVFLGIPVTHSFKRYAHSIYRIETAWTYKRLVAYMYYAKCIPVPSYFGVEHEQVSVTVTPIFSVINWVVFVFWYTRTLLLFWRATVLLYVCVTQYSCTFLSKFFWTCQNWWKRGRNRTREMCPSLRLNIKVIPTCWCLGLHSVCEMRINVQRISG